MTDSQPTMADLRERIRHLEEQAGAYRAALARIEDAVTLTYRDISAISSVDPNLEGYAEMLTHEDSRRLERAWLRLEPFITPPE